MGFLFPNLVDEAVGMAPLVHHKENVADVDANAAGQLRVEEDVAGE